MTFLNPWMLLGGLAVGIPIALHFFYRARYRPLPWGAMKFLRLALEQTSRRLRFQELILLMLRIAICIILALALARPASKSLSATGGRGEAVDAVLVIDVSYSMAAKESENKTRLDRAKEAAVKVIDNLPPNSTVQVVACSDKAVTLGPRTPSNLDQARHLVRNLKVTSQSTDFEPGFTEAALNFDKATAANKEVYLFSDMQRAGWERQSTAIRSKCEEIKNQATLYLVRCAEKKVKNVAVLGITPQTDVPHVDTRINFTVLLKNGGAEPVTGLSLTLEVDGKALPRAPGAPDVKSDRDARSIDRIGPGETRAVTVTGKIDRPGLHLLTARVKDDELDEDNEYNRFLLVRDKVRVLVVDGLPNSREPTRAASYNIGHSLLPLQDELKATHHVQLRIIRPEEASAGALADRDVCILVNVAAAQIRGEFAKALDGFVRGGKALMITAGNNVVARDYNATLSDLLPMPLVEAGPYVAPADAPLTPDLDSIEVLSFLARFKEGGRNPLQNLAKADTYRILPVEDPRVSENRKVAGRVLLRFNDGRPMLLSKPVGDGEVLLLTTTVDLSWTFLGINPAFPMFMNGCLAHLAQRSGGNFNRVAGEPLKWSPPDAGRDYYLVKPDRDRVRLGRPREQDGRPTLTAHDTARAGIYEIVADGGDAPARFALVPDLRESDNLEALADDQIDAQLGGDVKAVHLSTGFDGSAFTGTERSRKEWTIWVLTALLLFALGEMLWAWFCGRAW